MNWLDSLGQRSTSLWPHNALVLVQHCNWGSGDCDHVCWMLTDWWRKQPAGEPLIPNPALKLQRHHRAVTVAATWLVYGLMSDFIGGITSVRYGPLWFLFHFQLLCSFVTPETESANRKAAGGSSSIKAEAERPVSDFTCSQWTNLWSPAAGKTTQSFSGHSVTLFLHSHFST